MAIKITLIILGIAALIGFGILAGVKFYAYYVALEETKRDSRYGSRDNKLVPKGKGTAILATVIAALSLTFLILVPGNIHQVNTGEVAVVRHMGKISGYREPGLHVDFYMTNSYEIYDTKIQTIEVNMETYSSDNQIIGVQTTFQYSIQSDMIEYIATNIGSQSALEARLKPIIIDATKTVFAKNNAESMISNRAQLTADINSQVTNAVNIMTPYEIIDGNFVYHPMVIINNVLVTNLDFTDDFEAAVAAKVAQEQKKQQALIEQQQALAQAENDKKIAIQQAEAQAEAKRLAAEADAIVAKTKAEAAAEVALIAAQADAEKAKIEADAAEYQGKKQAAIQLQALASCNGWTVVTVDEPDGTTYYKLMKSDGTIVTQTELDVGVKNYLEKLKYEQWDGKLPVYQMSDSGTITIVQP